MWSDIRFVATTSWLFKLFELLLLQRRFQRVTSEPGFSVIQTQISKPGEIFFRLIRTHQKLIKSHQNTLWMQFCCLNCFPALIWFHNSPALNNWVPYVSRIELVQNSIALSCKDFKPVNYLLNFWVQLFWNLVIFISFVYSKLNVLRKSSCQ